MLLFLAHRDIVYIHEILLLSMIIILLLLSVLLSSC